MTRYIFTAMENNQIILEDSELDQLIRNLLHEIKNNILHEYTCIFSHSKIY